MPEPLVGWYRGRPAFDQASVDPQVESLTPEQCGVTPAALHAARAMFRLDGLAPIRQLIGEKRDGYDQAAIVADCARAIDREWRHTMPLDWL